MVLNRSQRVWLELQQEFPKSVVAPTGAKEMGRTLTGVLESVWAPTGAKEFIMVLE